MLCRDGCLRRVLRVLVSFVFGAFSCIGADLTMAQTSYEQGQRQQGPAQAQSNELARGSSGGSSFRMIPTFSVSERYDSNVFRGAGRQQSDFVTDIRPGVRLTYSSDLVDGRLTGSAISSIYVNNPGLNYVGAQASFDATLDKISERVIRGFGLRASGSVLYYPEQPAFVTPGALQSDFLRGIQARRNNALSNISTIQGTYAINPLVQLNSLYSFQTMRFLGQPDYVDQNTPIPLFDTTTHSMSVGPGYRISPDHNIGASYGYRQVEIGSSTSGISSGGRSFSIHSASATWNWTLSREFMVEISPGVSVASQIPDRLLWTMGAGLHWLGHQKSASLTFSRGFYPSYYGEASLLVSNLVGASFSYNLTDKLTVVLGASYALNSRSGQTRLRFESIGVSGGLNYSLYPGVVASITGSHSDYSIEQGSSGLKYDRQVGLLTLTAEWN